MSSSGTSLIKKALFRVRLNLCNLVQVKARLIFLIFSLLEESLELLDLVPESLVLLLLQDKLLDAELSVILLSFELCSELSVLLNQASIFIIDTLRDICDQFQVMPELIFFLFELGSLVAFLSFPLLDGFLGLGDI